MKEGNARCGRLLLFRLSALGDVVMLLPVLKALGEQYPGVEVVLVSQPFVAPLVSPLPNVRFIPARIRDKHKGLGGLWRLAREIAQLGPYDGVADMHSVLRVWLVRSFLRLRLLMRHPRSAAIDKGRAAKRRLTRGACSLPLRHTVQRYGDVLARLGYPVEVAEQLGGFAGGEIPPELAEQLVAAGPRVGFAPFAKHRGKIYPVERAERLVALLLEAGCRVFLFGGGEGEKAVFDGWRAEHPELVSVMDYGLRFGGELELMRRLDTMISMDSANMHLASWAGTPVVSVWGATHPNAGFMGWGQCLDNAVQDEELGCRPCSIFGNKPCARGDYACLDIAPERIRDRVFGLQSGG
ncbi:MAG: hypothetical protein CSA97_02500 [Bacteroidetes bacterium]|nr:MAG: hypothetical protein CSA97_02500 [Bacteroidota bacterium]